MQGGGIQISRCLKAAVELFGHYGYGKFFPVG
jgi:hypothetical protein